MSRSFRQKAKQANSGTSRYYNLMDLIDVYRVFYPNTKQYTFFSAPQRIFFKIDHILSNKASLNRYKKIVSYLYLA